VRIQLNNSGVTTGSYTNASITVNQYGIVTSASDRFNAAGNGQILIGALGSDATLGNITQGDGITVTNGAGSITVAANVNQGSTSGYYAIYWDTKTKSFWYT